MTFRALGIDPGTSSPGAAIIERNATGWRLVESPVITSWSALLEFLSSVFGDDLHCVCSEGQTVHHTKTEGYGSAEILRCLGAAEIFARLRRIPYIEVHPRTWRKRVAGSGNATKKQTREVVRRAVSGIPSVFGLNRSDAVAIALAGSMQAGGRVPGGRGRA